MKESIAERKLWYSLKGSSERKELIIRIGIPYLDEEGMARCRVEWDGLFETDGDLYGIDLVQAFYLAVDVEPRLERLQKKYDFFWPSGEQYKSPN